MAKQTKQKRPGRGSDQFIVRLPPGMRDEIAQKAGENGRSMNAEVIARLGASFKEVLSWEGMVQVSKRMEAAASAFEKLFFDVRDRRASAAPEQTPSGVNWKGFLRLSLVTCPVELHAATLDAFPLIPGSGSNYTIEIDQFIPRAELDPAYVRDSYYLVPDGRIGHDAFAVIRETIRATNKLALARLGLADGGTVVLALEARDEGMFAMLLRRPCEVRDPATYFERVQDVHVTKDMLDLSRHIVEMKSGHFDPHELEKAPAKEKGPVDPLTDTPENVVSLMDRLRKSAA
jgi:hypothetical protein